MCTQLAAHSHQTILWWALSYLKQIADHGTISSKGGICVILFCVTSHYIIIWVLNVAVIVILLLQLFTAAQILYDVLFTLVSCTCVLLFKHQAVLYLFTVVIMLLLSTSDHWVLMFATLLMPPPGTQSHMQVYLWQKHFQRLLHIRAFTVSTHASTYTICTLCFTFCTSTNEKRNDLSVASGCCHMERRPIMHPVAL